MTYGLFCNIVTDDGESEEIAKTKIRKGRLSRNHCAPAGGLDSFDPPNKAPKLNSATAIERVARSRGVAAVKLMQTVLGKGLGVWACALPAVSEPCRTDSAAGTASRHVPRTGRMAGHLHWQ